MELQSGRAPYAFKWKDFWVSSDTTLWMTEDKRVVSAIKSE